jgi:hypothetical protein
MDFFRNIRQSGFNICYSILLAKIIITRRFRVRGLGNGIYFHFSSVLLTFGFASALVQK